MLPELLRYSSASHLLKEIDEDVQRHHRLVEGEGANAAVVSYQEKEVGLWEGWKVAAPAAKLVQIDEEGEEGELDFGALGL